MIRSRIVLTVLTVAIAGLMAAGNVANAAVSRPTAPAAHTARQVTAAVADPSYLCLKAYPSSKCLYPINAVLTNGNTIGVGYSSWRFVKVTLCQIGSLGCTPFNAGSDCNTRYSGHTSYDILWNANQNYTIRDYTASNDQVKISDTLDNNAWWVQSGGWFINVGATNHAHVNCTTGEPYILTYRPDTGTVWTRAGNSYDAWKQNWEFN